MGDSNITSRVALLSKLAGKEFIQFSTEDTIGNELAFFTDLGSHF
jgi:hypothetical protein